MRVRGFEWDDGNCLHIELGHGIAPYEAEQVFARSPLFRRTKKGHYAVFGPTASGRHLVVIFELKLKGVARVITGWDMKQSEVSYYKRRGMQR